jgi:anti-anti-sigma factor
MSTEQASAGPAPVLRIEGELTIFRAAELKGLLLSDPAPQEIDLSGVTEMDSAGLQLLLAAQQAANRQGGRLRLLDQSAAVTEVLALLNLAACFQDPPSVEART